MDELIREFSAELSGYITGEFKSDRATKLLYSTDASIHKIEPLGVIFPHNSDELSAVVSLAQKYKIPLVARGAGSSLAGQAIGKGLIVDCSRYLNKLVKINAEERTAIVEPGMVLDDLNLAARKLNLHFGPDPASSERATLGGCIGNNAAGAHSIIHGMTSDHVLSADVVLADGSNVTLDSKTIAQAEQIAGRTGGQNSSLESNLYQAALDIRENYTELIKNTWPTSWRRVSGYNLNYLIPWSATHPPQWEVNQIPYPPINPGTINLAPLLAGSEGTLGILREATVRLMPLRKYTILVVLNFDSINSACAIVPRILEELPSAIELIPESLINLARSIPAYANQLSFVVNDPAAMLVVEYSGNDPAELKDKAERLIKLRGWLTEPVIATAALQQKQVWDVRKVGLGILMSRLGDVKPIAFIEDMSVPVERLSEFVTELDVILKNHGTYADYYGHASVGCLHIRPLLNIKTRIGRAEMRTIAQEAVDLVLSMGGVVAAEHGDGITRGEWIEKAYGPEILKAFRIIKTAADPLRILNPGKIVDTPKMDSSLRYDDGYQPKGWKPVMTFASLSNDSQKLVEAIEQCNGVGVCRKSGGVMCPSFQATQDEMFSTRGRANLLRAMISNDFETHEEALHAVKATLDKCLACKGCKAECPSAVDIAKLKYEFEHYYYSILGNSHPLRDYLFGYISIFAKIGQIISPAVNHILLSDVLKTLNEKLFGIAKKRDLPKLTRTSIHKQFSRKNTHTQEPDCLLLTDTFNEYFFPDIGMDALQVLRSAGCKVKLLSTIGAGRTLISKGFLVQAKKHADRLMDEIKRLDPEGKVPIIGLEPSEIYTLKDEFPDLLPDDERVKGLSKRTFMIDEFILRADYSGTPWISKIDMTELAEQDRTNVLIHGHCYQKAQPLSDDGLPIGVAATEAMLRAVGYSTRIIDDGCCGMAGAFGYEAEHYQFSMQVGELKLFPAIRQSNGSIVTAAGVSCKSQIEDGTGRKALHPISLVARRCRL